MKAIERNLRIALAGLGAGLALLALCVPALASDDDVTRADVAAAHWLAEVDQAQYDKSWNDAAPVFKAAVTQADWARKVDAVRVPLGQPLKRELADATFSRSLPGAPDGQYVVIHYRTQFANKASAIETVTPMKGPDGAWHVSGYFVR